MEEPESKVGSSMEAFHKKVGNSPGGNRSVRFLSSPTLTLLSWKRLLDHGNSLNASNALALAKKRET